MLLTLLGCRGQQDYESILSSLEKVDGHPLYVMHLDGSYEATAPPLDRGISRWTSTLSPQQAPWACSLFAALADPQKRVFGRNFDWRHSPALILFTDPPDGFASVTMVDIEYLGFTGDRAQRLTELPIDERRRLLDAPYFPFDGMNEHGLSVGMAAVPAYSVPVDPGKQTIGSLQIIREMLDHARNVDEAASILESYNIDMSGGPAIHYLVADASGQAALFESYQGETIAIPNAAQWHQATNFLLSARGESPQGVCKRYDRISAFLSDARGDISDQEAMTLLSSVAQENTQWSVVYEMGTGDVNVVMGRDWDNVHVFHLNRTAP